MAANCNRGGMGVRTDRCFTRWIVSGIPNVGKSVMKCFEGFCGWEVGVRWVVVGDGAVTVMEIVFLCTPAGTECNPAQPQASSAHRVSPVRP